MQTPVVNILYRNWRSEVAWRRIVPVELLWGSTVYHPEAQLLLLARDLDRQAERTFAVRDILAADAPIQVECVTCLGFGSHQGDTCCACQGSGERTVQTPCITSTSSILTPPGGVATWPTPG